MNSLKCKKLLILAGADVHVKVVMTAKELGVYTIVTDNLALGDSPAKQVADEYWNYSITAVSEIVERCREDKVDGVLNLCIDPAQIPYQQICEKLGLPCYGTKEQFELLTDKRLFKDYCMSCGVGTIPEYSENDIETRNIKYPILVKPTISRGSRGQTICFNKEQVYPAIEIAHNESKNGGVLIERFMQDLQDMALAYMVVGGEPYLLKIGDRYLGKREDNLDRQQMAAVLPSKHTKEYLAKCDPRVKTMIKNMGITFGAVFFQGFYEEGHVFMYDPGLRFPGSDFDVVQKQATGFDSVKAFVRYAMTGDVHSCYGDIKTAYNYAGGHCLIFAISAREGKIATIKGVNEVAKHPYVYSVHMRRKVGDFIENRGDVTQRVVEFCAYIPKDGSIEDFVDDVYHTIQIQDGKGKDMIISKVRIKDSDYQF